MKNGVGRPRTEPRDRVSTAVRLPRDLHKKLAHEAIDRDVTVNALITHACEQLLSKNGRKRTARR